MLTERERAMHVVEKYFDVDIHDKDAAYDVLVDNGISSEVATEVASDIFPEEGNGAD